MGDQFKADCPGFRGRLELELLWASTSGTRTELASGLLLDLDTLDGLLPLHTLCPISINGLRGYTDGFLLYEAEESISAAHLLMRLSRKLCLSEIMGV